METAAGPASMRIGFTKQLLTAHGGLAAWSAYVAVIGLREQSRAVLPHTPRSPNAYDEVDPERETAGTGWLVMVRTGKVNT